MIIDFSIANFRSFKREQTLSMNVENSRGRHQSNYSSVDAGRLDVLRSAAILGANASGKSNLLTALMALKWMVVSSGSRGEGKPILPYEPYRLSDTTREAPVVFEIEFIVPSGVRYRYEISYLETRVIEERLWSFAKRQRAMVFDRNADDSWETIRFGGTYKGGSRRLPFFANASYLSRAGNDASAPDTIREVYQYFKRLTLIGAGQHLMSSSSLTDSTKMKAVSEIICLADTGVSQVTRDQNENAPDIKLPEDMPEDLKVIIQEQNEIAYHFWIASENGELIEFEQDAMSDGTVRLLEVLPVILNAFEIGAILLFDEMDSHFHTHLLSLILRLFNDEEINSRGSQLIFTTHDTNVLDSEIMRRDQIWFVSKSEGESTLKSLDEYDKKYVRSDSPFESFYKDGRLGALPKFSYANVKETILKSLPKEIGSDA
ncbi:ATP-binding protein [Pontixanthobacter aestiaquae]|uniref:AAA family ATPase n=1 Tax=Pontixanthobacter aestiaquae TaxID=1509367 RepID=A0A844Z9V0_9SPHN|nr:ATP-binding protein [Pontixanthobacter aestiaquae]MDN3645207.1 ATP-binding protein [Pontixanthobacter aestiaquae]MXO83793.1 AAA family ATPase [Pontixanthobacter aestiaquae]